jgi:hypothetical protein
MITVRATCTCCALVIAAAGLVAASTSLNPAPPSRYTPRA